MFKSIAPLIAIGGVLVISAPASAQQQDCKSEISATGRAALTETGARNNAITSWRRNVIARYGEFYANFEKGQGTALRCAKTLMGLQRCEAHGRPCAVPEASASHPSGIPEIACTQGDSRNCDPGVKWVQSKLNSKGCKTRIDGAEGPKTAEALKCFQKQAKLSITGEIDASTVDALKK